MLKHVFEVKSFRPVIKRPVKTFYLKHLPKQAAFSCSTHSYYMLKRLTFLDITLFKTGFK